MAQYDHDVYDYMVEDYDPVDFDDDDDELQAARERVSLESDPDSDDEVWNGLHSSFLDFACHRQLCLERVCVDLVCIWVLEYCRIESEEHEGLDVC